MNTARATTRSEHEIGDAVTPVGGAFAGLGFVVTELRWDGDQAEARTRPIAPLRGGPAPAWVPFDDLRPLYASGCPACGAMNHSRCAPPVRLPAAGAPVRLRQALRMEAAPHELHAGMRGRIVEVDPRWCRAVVELDEVLVDGDFGGGFLYVAAEDFWELFELTL